MGNLSTLRSPSTFLTQELPLSSNDLSLVFQRWEDLYQGLENPPEAGNHDGGLSCAEEAQPFPENNQDTEDIQAEPPLESSNTINGTENLPLGPASTDEGGDHWICDNPSELSSSALRRLIQECWGDGGGTQMESEPVPAIVTRRQSSVSNATTAIHTFPDDYESTEPLFQPLQPATPLMPTRPSTPPIRVFQHYTWQLGRCFGLRARAPDMLLLGDHLVAIDEKNSRKMREREQWLFEMENMVDPLFGDQSVILDFVWEVEEDTMDFS